MNPRAVEKFGRAATQPGNFAGNGPFTLAEWRPHQRIVVKKNPGYRAAAVVLLDIASSADGSLSITARVRGFARAGAP